ncbi:MAG: hypothetical protein K0Q72_1621, partial [Armatimonadetes bacterium]|nr:hypothetical protein [Armatimonadota bacterium]
MQDPDTDSAEVFTNHKHSPAHLFRPGATYFITAKTLDGAPILAPEYRREELLGSLEFAFEKRGWTLLAWVVLPNHYHTILKAPEAEAVSLSSLLGAIHGYTSRRWNKEDRAPGRKVWYQYWDVCLTGLGAFYARLNYIHYHPIKHGLVADPSDYRYSSYTDWLNAGVDTLREIEAAYP